MKRSSAYDRDRRRRFRLKEALTPREPVQGWEDPLALGEEAITHLALLRKTLAETRAWYEGDAQERVARVDEIIRKLAVGPDDGAAA